MQTVPSVSNAGKGDSPLKFLGKGKVSKVDLHNGDDFRAAVPETPNENFVWAMYGLLEVSNEGSYELCISSDDG